MNLNNKHILVTGASSGIGEATVKLIVEMGGKVIVSGRNKIKLQQIKEEFGVSILSEIVCDLLLESEIEILADTVVPLDGIVHCAGGVHTYPIRYLSFDKIDETMRLNFHSAVVLISQLDRKKKLSKNASIVFISSISGQHPHKGGTAYSASKVALESFSKVVAMEYGHKKIRCNVVSPGMVNTPLYEKASDDVSQEVMQQHIDKYPLGLGQPNDVANAIVYFLSDASKWVTGANLVMDGGVLLGY